MKGARAFLMCLKKVLTEGFQTLPFLIRLVFIDLGYVQPNVSRLSPQKKVILNYVNPFQNNRVTRLEKRHHSGRAQIIQHS